MPRTGLERDRRAANAVCRRSRLATTEGPALACSRVSAARRLSQWDSQSVLDAAASADRHSVVHGRPRQSVHPPGGTRDREMDYAGILQLLADLSVGVLGFSGVVAVLGRRGAGEWTLVDRVRFFTMVRLTVSVLILAVLPFPFHSAGLTGETIWGWCSGIAALIMVLNLVVAFIDNAFSRSVLSDPGTSRLASAYIFITAPTAIALFATNATGIGLERSFTPYLVATLLLFGAPVVLFIRLLHSAIGPGRAA